MEYDNLVNIIIYITVIVLLFIVLQEDLTNLINITSKIKSYKKNNKEELWKKLENTLYFDHGIVFWRRCLIFSIILSPVLLFLVLGRLPNSRELSLSILIIYFFSYCFCINYRKICSNTIIKEGTNTINLIKNY